MKTEDLKKGTIVRANKDLDPEGANVKEGQVGVVFGDANCYGDEAGPIVQWFKVVEDELGYPLHQVGLAGICNVYDDDVEPLLLPGPNPSLVLPPSVEGRYAVARLLHHSWKDIDYTYEKLTKEERKLLTKKEFTEILAWLKRG